MGKIVGHGRVLHNALRVSRDARRRLLDGEEVEWRMEDDNPLKIIYALLQFFYRAFDAVKPVFPSLEKRGKGRFSNPPQSPFTKGGCNWSKPQYGRVVGDMSYVVCRENDISGIFL